MSIIFSALFISLKITLISLFITLVLGILLAWKISRVETHVKKFIEWVVTLSIFFPPTAIGYILLLILGKRGPVGTLIFKYFNTQIIFTWWAGVIASSVIIFPIIYQNIKNGILSLDPTYIEAGRELGLTKWQILIHIIIPMIRKNILTALLLAFGRGIGEFGATIIVAGNIPERTQTIPMAIYSAIELGDSYSANIILAIMCTLSFFILIFYNFSLKRGEE
ncbi:MAG: molybdate ABC transporter permease subunit [Fusobacteriaceae bacterium]